jgi:hypothetical protein
MLNKSPVSITFPDFTFCSGMEMTNVITISSTETGLAEPRDQTSMVQEDICTPDLVEPKVNGGLKAHVPDTFRRAKSRNILLSHDTLEGHITRSISDRPSRNARLRTRMSRENQSL